MNIFESMYNKVAGLLPTQYRQEVVPLVDDISGDYKPVFSVDIDKILKESQFNLLKGTLSNNDRMMLQNLQATLTKPITDKNSYYLAIDSLKDNSLAESIVEKVRDDVLNKDYNDKSVPFFKVVIKSDLDKNNVMEDDAQSFINNLNLFRVVTEYLDDILWYGDYSFILDWENKEIDDLDSQKSVLPIYVRGKFKYLVDSNRIFQSSKDYVTFRLGSQSKKLLVKDTTNARFVVKLSKGLFSPTVVKLFKTLELLENLIPMGEVDSLSRKMQFYMRVPKGTTMEEAYDMTRKYETMLLGLLKTDNSTDLSSIMNEMLKIKVIPLFGSQEELSEFNIPKAEKIDLTYINDLREQLNSRLSLPRSFIFADDPELSSPSYLRKLEAIRGNLGSAVKHIVYEYIVTQKKIKIDYDSISIITPPIVGIDSLDSMEYIQLVNTSLSDLNRVIQEMGETISNASNSVDKEKLVKFLNKKVKPIVGEAIFKVPDPEETPDEGGY